MSENYDYNFKSLDTTFDIICREFLKIKDFQSYCIFRCLRIMISNYFKNKGLYENIKSVQNYEKIKSYLDLKYEFYIEIYKISVKNWIVFDEALKSFVFEKKKIQI